MGKDVVPGQPVLVPGPAVDLQALHEVIGVAVVVAAAGGDLQGLAGSQVDGHRVEPGRVDQEGGLAGHRVQADHVPDEPGLHGAGVAVAGQAVDASVVPGLGRVPGLEDR